MQVWKCGHTAVLPAKYNPKRQDVRNKGADRSIV
jgi:hypothetical protein